MYQVDQYLNEADFPLEKIRNQLEKMIGDPLFSKSPILKKFLSFIVNEKLAGRSNCLKEYTIGLNILNKSKDFKPQENGIIRIHAGRLRQALAHYYNNQGALDEIRIALPKGNYIPVFSRNADYFQFSELDLPQPVFSDPFDSGNRVIVSVIPFHCIEEKGFIKHFADGLGGQLCNSLRKVRNFSVISYNATRLIAEKISGIQEIAAVFGAHYVFTGSIHYQPDKVRFMIEMFRTESGEQLWSRMFERKITPENIFEVQDEIMKQILDELQKPGVFNFVPTKAEVIMAVA